MYKTINTLFFVLMNSFSIAIKPCIKQSVKYNEHLAMASKSIFMDSSNYAPNLLPIL